MKKKRVYCSFCGAKISVSLIDEKYRDHCNGCNTTFYENPLPVASSIVINELREVLLVQRNNEPYKNMWCLPIGFAESGESIQQAALRELREEAGVEGHIAGIIDIDTVSNYYYGDLIIITFEVRQLSDTFKAGDDALDAKFFPLNGRPPLAWESNEKALQKFAEKYIGVWTLLDSLKLVQSDIATHHDIPKEKSTQHQLISTVIAKIINADIELFNAKWKSDMSKFHDDSALLFSIHKNALETLSQWLAGGGDIQDFQEFKYIGIALKNSGVSVNTILNAAALSRKSIWMHILEKNLFHSPLEMHAALEINNKIILFYDKITYFIMKGYEHS